MKILVTGGAGFIGSQIVDAYLAAGHEVAIIDNLTTGLTPNVNSEAKMYEVDLRVKEDVDRVVKDFKPEFINHHAAHLSVSESVAKPQFDAEVNLLGFLNLIEAARQENLKKIIVASTGGAIYGDANQLPTSEDYPAKPVSPYGVAKLAMENYLHYYRVEHNIDWVALRYSNVYGPRQNPKGETGVVAVFLEKLGSGQAPFIFGDGLQTRDYVFVSDVVQANISALSFGQGSYNIGTGIETNVVEIFNLLQKLMGTSFPETHADPRPGEQQRSALNNIRAKKDLNWQPRVKFSDGLKQTVQWFNDNKERDEDTRD